MSFKKALMGVGVSGALVVAIGMGVYAVPAMPGGNDGSAPGGAPGASSAANISRVGATSFTSGASESGKSYSSSTGGENAVLVSGGKVELNDVKIDKSGDEGDENSDFYGTNAGVLAYDNGELVLKDATITTNGGHANGVFAYGSGVIEISDSMIQTSGNNSGGIMVTGGGSLTATDVKVETAGNSSAAIRSDRGGGTMTIKDGSYKTTGVGSPAIYSTANVTVEEAELEATASEGVVIEGFNSVSLKGVELTDTNTTLNGNSETYKNVFIYQSMSGDAEEGTGTFSAQDTEFTTNKGDTFFVTNTSAVINLRNNTYHNNDANGAFLLAQTGKWGTSGQNGGQVSLNLDDDEVTGAITIDEISSLELHLGEGSYLKGAMTGEGTKNVKIADKESVWVLEGDVTLDFLEDADATFQNIYGNGHSLTVNGETVPINTGTAPEHKVGYQSAADVIKNNTVAKDCIGGADNEDCAGTIDDNKSTIIWFIIGGVAGVFVIAMIVGIVMMVQKRKRSERGIKVTLNENEMGRSNRRSGENENGRGDSRVDGGSGRRDR